MTRRAAAVLARAVRSSRAELAAISDGELLRRFAASGDQTAFAAVVARHSGMVAGVCRRVLRSQADAEDACQAVFLVLAKKAGSTRWQPSVANWLYATARRVAHNARVAAARRARREGAAAVPETVTPADAMTGRELVAALDEELDRLPPRYRGPLVLCYLEGLTRDEAAARLGVPESTLKSQLERGRKRLAGALTARGCALGVALLASAATSPAWASPPRLEESILAAVGGAPSPAAAALARGVAVNTWAKTVAVPAAVLAVLAAGVGVGAALPGAPDRPAMKKDEPARAAAPVKADGKPLTVTGTVLGPDGKPVEGAAINTLKKGDFDKPAVQELAKTDAAGRFAATLEPLPPGRPDLRFVAAAKAGFGPDWVRAGELTGDPVTLRLEADDVPVRGRVTDLEGRPVPKATVRVKSVAAGDLGKVWAEWPRSPYVALQRAGKDLWTPIVGGLPESVTADADGRFEVRGVGRGRLLGLVFEADGLETAACRVVADPGFDPKAVGQPTQATMPGGSYQPGPDLYGPTFAHAGRPSQPIAGTVTDATTGKPVPGVQVTGHVDGPRWWENHAVTKADADGRFTLAGVAKADKVSLFVFPGERRPYLSFSTTVSGRPGLTAIPADLKLPRGVRVKGRVVEKGSGRPVVGAGIRYEPLADNKYHADRMADRRNASGMAYSTGADGRFEFVALPGAGIVQAQGETRGRTAGTPYTQVRVAREDLPRADPSHLEGLGEAFSAADGHIITLSSLSGYKIIDPKPTDEAVEVEIVFDRGLSVSGRVLGPDGKPAAGVTAYRLTACYDVPQKLTDGAFTAIALEPDHPRAVLFVDEARKLSAAVALRGDEKDLAPKLQPWGKLTGRLLDADGKPAAGVSVSASVRNSVKYQAFAAAVQERSTTTDADGRFAVDVPAGEVEYVLGFRHKNQYLDTGYRPGMPGHVVKPGEATDVGDVTVKGD